MGETPPETCLKRQPIGADISSEETECRQSRKSPDSSESRNEIDYSKNRVERTPIENERRIENSANPSAVHEDRRWKPCSELVAPNDTHNDVIRVKVEC